MFMETMEVSCLEKNCHNLHGFPSDFEETCWKMLVMQQCGTSFGTLSTREFDCDCQANMKTSLSGED